MNQGRRWEGIRKERCKKWKGNREREEDDLGPCNYLFCISIMPLHEYQSSALDGQPRRNQREVSEVMIRQERKGNNCRCIFFQSSKEKEMSFWLLHEIHVNSATERSFKLPEKEHMKINFWSIATQFMRKWLHVIHLALIKMIQNDGS